MEKDWIKYINNEKYKYKKLGYIKCPAFDDEEIHFNYYGLNHIMYKNGIPRPKQEIFERFNFLSYVPNILKKVKTIDYEEKRIKEKSIAYFWTIIHKINSQLSIRIIIRRLNNGRLHFFSIMDE